MITLRVQFGYLIQLPTDEVGPLLIPFDQGTSWAATLTGDAKAFERTWWTRPRPRQEGFFYAVPEHLVQGSVVEFGVNRRAEEPIEQNLGEPTGRFAVAVPQTKRRWYGVVSQIDLNSERNGSISLIQTDDAKRAFRDAPGYSESWLPPAELSSFAEAIKAGDLLALLAFCDWIGDKGDLREPLLRQRLIEATAELFPEMRLGDKEDN